MRERLQIRLLKRESSGVRNVGREMNKISGSQACLKEDLSGGDLITVIISRANNSGPWPHECDVVSYYVTSSKHHVTSSQHHMMSSKHYMTSSKQYVTSSKHHVTSSKRYITSSKTPDGVTKSLYYFIKNTAWRHRNTTLRHQNTTLSSYMLFLQAPLGFFVCYPTIW